MVKERKRTDPEIRFWRYVEIAGADECWEWTGSLCGGGYGNFSGAFRLPSGKFKHCVAHRYSWFLAHGKFPELLALHKCDNKKCVNPAHLFEGTYGDNNRDRVAKGRDRNMQKAHCKHGHQFSGRNTFTDHRGNRGCRTCRNTSSKIAKRRIRAAEKLRKTIELL